MDSTRIELHPGFPMTANDYRPLLDALQQLPSPGDMVIAHSQGALTALRTTTSDRQLILLAPSDPRRPRPLRRPTARILRAIAHLPALNRRLGRLLRTRSFTAFGLTPPPGQAPSLDEAGRRLLAEPVTVSRRPNTWVLTSPTDHRHREQVDLAHVIGATVLLAPGGHMFPITEPHQTASLIQSAVGLDSH